MELALNMGAFEVLDGNIIQGPWASLSNEEVFCVDGGRKVSVAGIICSGLAIIGGVCTIVAGCAALAAPEPTGLTKVAGVATIAAGASAVAGGVAGILWACGY